MLTHSFEDLAQTFRVLLESDWKFKQLITVDRPEAVGTLETAINTKLNAFHNLYDLMLKDLGNPVDWYSTPELCVILSIRNARHHNKANRIRSIYNFHTKTCNSPQMNKYTSMLQTSTQDDQNDFLSEAGVDYALKSISPLSKSSDISESAERLKKAAAGNYQK